MTNYFTYGDKELCCGCRGCEQICPKKCISMNMDKEGFIYPIVEKENCIDCKLCEKVCPIKGGGYKNKEVLNSPEAYGGYNKNKNVLEKSTSGGAFTAIINSFFSEDIIVYGAAFNEDLVVKHFCAKNIKEVEKLRGSKYVQSDVQDSYSKIRAFLRDGKKVLFSGTPCQVAGLKSFLQVDYENLFCVDIVCHGVPSPKVFELYKKHLEEKNKMKLLEINFRDKSQKGWHTSFVSHKYSNGKIKKEIHCDDDFIIGFYKDYYVRPICHKCPFTKTKRVSDITIADFWGVEQINPELNNMRGTSLILLNTKKAVDIKLNLINFLELETINLEKAIEFNPQLKHPTNPNENRSKFMNDLSNGYSFNELKKKYLKKRILIKRIISRTIDKKTKYKIKKILRLN
ncbi:Coenzyme F420 hydrogenase/dehydrogenase, beta subunit C-terminal domain [Paraclostridium bifermentans]|uniref:Coenzyme F420 hydrogenase/dehydrogenase, beta subunit C-terminal domain n=1 Tax=Paraclostridium bifermentans TaxID=1490 RepID=UPI0025AFDD9C|nr:Coenzyme F420 hydrogenase/dehydrogenase, beta subunit C-terminal domain [Paraclostridium bifermentans]